MSWFDEVYTVISSFCPIGGIFSLSDLYEYEAHFQALYPNNRHVRDKLRQTLQFLRDATVLEFLDDSGTYRRLK